MDPFNQCVGAAFQITSGLERRFGGHPNAVGIGRNIFYLETFLTGNRFNFSFLLQKLESGRVTRVGCLYFLNFLILFHTRVLFLSACDCLTICVMIAAWRRMPILA